MAISNIRGNMGSMQTGRMLNIIRANNIKSAQKLSSGFKINRASDNASGLAISEKLRKYYGALTQASSNAQDGISAVQTADGALSTVGDSLQRMNELSIKAANGFLSDSDRRAIQAEMNSLVSEVDRVATTTKFNETYLLNGANSNGSVSYDKALSSLQAPLSNVLNTDSAKASFAATGAVGLNVDKQNANSADTSAINQALGQAGQDIGYGNTVIDSARVIRANTGANGEEMRYMVIDSTSPRDRFKESDSEQSIADRVNRLSASASKGDDLYNIKAFSNMDDLRAALKADLGKDVSTISDNGSSLSIKAFSDEGKGNLNLHIGADASSGNSARLSLTSMNARSLGLNGLDITGGNGSNALKAIDTISSALSMVNSQRAGLGASQNRLESTVRNLGNVTENTVRSDSVIRDTDIASEMVNRSKNNILEDFNMSLLAQANSGHAAILRLLQ